MRKFIFVLFLFYLGVANAEEKVIHLYNWADYMTEDVLNDFTSETGIEVKSDYFASNEELIAKLQAGAFDYDIAVPSDYYVKLMVAQKLIHTIDLSLLPNRKNLEAKFQNPSYDPNNAYSIPYFWGTTGIAYNRSKTKREIHSWKELFSSDWNRKINFLDDMREVIGAALRLNGASINSTDIGALEKVRPYLLQSKKNVRTFNSSNYREILDAGDVYLTQAFSGDMVQLRKENPDIVFVIPDEGGTLFTDSLVIPIHSKHVQEAHAFINFILRPEIAFRLARDLGFATPNQKGFEKLPKNIQEDKAIYPPQSVLNHLEFVEDVGETIKTYESIWIDLKTY